MEIISFELAPISFSLTLHCFENHGATCLMVVSVGWLYFLGWVVYSSLFPQ